MGPFESVLRGFDDLVGIISSQWIQDMVGALDSRPNSPFEGLQKQAKSVHMRCTQTEAASMTLKPMPADTNLAYKIE